MITVNDWLEGARVRTLPAAVAPVLIGAGIAIYDSGFSFPRTLLAAIVALAFQVGVNFSNDYSDGIRGTDNNRQGPLRLTASGKVRPRTVLFIALGFFALACVSGLVLVVLSGQWWLILLGAAATLAAWYYTGGSHPYGYMGLGEVFVMVFFGWMATIGTAYVQTGNAPWYAWAAGTGVGLIACALLMINNIRDIPTDSQAGKITLAVRLGDRHARIVYSLTLLLSVTVFLIVTSIVQGIIGLVVSIGLYGMTFFPITRVMRGAQGRDLIALLKYTGIFELLYAVMFFICFTLPPIL
ncbi:1,4-dihydroxy-2-naphthoate polyprenyltransferase [Arcanobacterium buesumense]|uniref:1,4-dihydroxy-2-naphthoate octaprenyltransferase n=1 Tax=Arcanobacterium buesumense TaxID=2722751 RepID=A0A6H2EKF2_9ACTO|nr:1,4-dihydroxy-2-naphthoate polyprenyltransferase [Arcanobacterium buesumense]QJC21301.1 1,4-dihydroxy-2-naphthoate polyprenyltransferase [Arcanobacterium buesumense]